MPTRQADSRTHAHDLAGDRRITDGGQLALAILFFAVWVVDVFALRWTTASSDTVPYGVRAAVSGLLFASVTYLGAKSYRTLFSGRGGTPRLLRDGVFAIVRHPMYLAEILFYLGILLLGTSIAATGVWLLIITFLHLVAQREQQLVETFGDAYVRYMKDVPMWMPKARRSR